VPNLYRRDEQGRITLVPGVGARYEPEARLLSGSVGLLSTPADYLRFAQMLLNGGTLDGRRVLGAASVAQMLRSQLPPGIGAASAAFVGQEGYAPALGGAVLVDSAPAELAGAEGVYRWRGDAGTFFWIDPRNDLVGLVWTQFVPARAYPLELDFQRLVYAAVRPRGRSARAPAGDVRALAARPRSPTAPGRVRAAERARGGRR
jgi:CubicO group peptidase (beta-lactamase class C family)